MKGTSRWKTESLEGLQNYSVQLKQGGIPMYKGWEYELKFTAYADEPRTMIIDIEGPDHNYKRYFGDTGVNLTKEPTEYTYTFTMNDKTDPNGSLEFNLGKQKSTAPVYISNVSLKHKSGEEEIEVFEKDVTADGNYVYNGTFDQGSDRLEYWDVEAEDKEAEVKVTNVRTGKERKRELRVKVVVPEGATELNPVVVSQEDIAPLTKGVYLFSFDAYTPDGEADGMSTFVSGKKYKPELTKEKKNYNYRLKFDKNLTRKESSVIFKFYKPGTYYLDNVILTEDYLIKNGSFDS